MLARWRWLIDHLFRGNTSTRDLDEEIRAHLAIDAEQRIRDGESPTEAWAAARRDFGSVTLAKERTREAWGMRWLDLVLLDLRHAIVSFRRTAGFTVLACLVLALGICATATIFTVVHSVLLRPLRFPDPERLVMIWERPPSSERRNVTAITTFREWQRSIRSFEALAAFQTVPFNLIGSEEAVQVSGSAVTADFFRVLGVSTAIGRTFLPNEDGPTSPRVVVLTYGFWQQRFGGQADIIGQRVSINAAHHEVIGVLPAGFAFPGTRVLAYIPLRTAANDGRNYSVVARLRQTQSIEVAQSEMTAMAAHLARERPQQYGGWGATVVSLHEQTVGSARRPLLVLFAAVSLLMLIASANVAHLFLIRSAARSREFAVRRALGAGRQRLMHQLFVESLVLAAASGAVGVGVAQLGITSLVRFLPAAFPLPRLNELALDPIVLLFTAIVCLTVSFSCSVLPAVRSDRMSLTSTLNQANRTVAAGLTGVRSMLVMAELALTLPLLVGAGLMTQSLLRLNEVDLGFRPEGLLTARMLLLPVRDPAFHAEFVDDVLTRLRQVPGVVAAGSIGLLPMMGGNSGTWYFRTDQPEPRPSQRPGGDVSIITPGYFEAMRISVLKGRAFEEHDRMSAPRVAILNQTAAQMLFPGEEAVGKKLRVSWNRTPDVEVVGVVSDIRHSQLRTRPDPCLFMPNAQQPFPFSSLVVRTQGDPHSFVGVVKEQIKLVDPDQGIADIETMDQRVTGIMAQPKLETLVFALFGLVALALATIGVYGVLAYSVTQRRREIGVRLALGATPAIAFSMVVREGLRLTFAGAIAGCALALLLMRFMQGLLYEVEPLDPRVFAVVTIGLILVATCACAVPARRATRVNPAIALRED
jgi:putative ABC transport system permease protein